MATGPIRNTAENRRQEDWQQKSDSWQSGSEGEGKKKKKDKNHGRNGPFWAVTNHSAHSYIIMTVEASNGC